MNAPNPKRIELSQFLAENTPKSGFLCHLQILSVQPYVMVRPGVDFDIFEIYAIKYDRLLHTHFRLRIFAIDAIDYSIRPKNPGITVGGPPIKFSTDDPRLNDPDLQYVPGGDGEVFEPPRRYQLLELDQSWIIAVRFEVEEFFRETLSIDPQTGDRIAVTTEEQRP
jgi:hypothetical protein